MSLEPAFAAGEKRKLLLRLPRQDKTDDVSTHDCRAITVWVGDIFVLASGAREAHMILQDMLRRLQRFGCEVGLKKFAAASTTCLRHNVTEGPNGERFTMSKTRERLGAHVGMLPKEVAEANRHSRIQKGWKAFYACQRQLLNMGHLA